MESMEETLEYFSPDGRPLRASLAIVLTQQKITTFALEDVNVPPFARHGRSPVGTTPLASLVSEGRRVRSGIASPIALWIRTAPVPSPRSAATDVRKEVSLSRSERCSISRYVTFPSKTAAIAFAIVCALGSADRR